MKKSVRFLIVFLILWLAASLSCAAFVIYVDPYFHYHAAKEGKGYIMDDQRYINDGILKNFDYDAVICGSSMTECFRTSVMDEEFNTSSVKTPYSGGSYKEVGQLVLTACKNNPDLKIVVRALDCNRFFNTKDECDYDEEKYPTYLYDDNILNDVNYVFNKEALLTSVWDFLGRRDASKPLSFDDYSNWNNDYAFGIGAIKGSYGRDTLTMPETQIHLSEEDKEIINANISQNVTDIADAYPDVDFYVYYTPYSIYYIDYFRMEGVFDKQFEAEKYITSLLLEHKNIHVYSFFMQHDYIENADNYRDLAHHGQVMSDALLHWLSTGDGLITAQNFEEYYDDLYEYYSNYDYEALFEDWY